MKRHPALVPLSHDHHQVLVIAQRLCRATNETATEISGAFLAAWESEEKKHLRLEEELLLPAYAAHGDPGHPVVLRMLQDHMLIRRDAVRLANDPPLELLHELGNRLADHVRLEERELFPMIEETIPESELEALGKRLRADAS
ncbi:MAG: hemerythrin domain-containing protein [Solirubrobacteraceae bacterium]